MRAFTAGSPSCFGLHLSWAMPLSAIYYSCTSYCWLQKISFSEWSGWFFIFNALFQESSDLRLGLNTLKYWIFQGHKFHLFLSEVSEYRNAARWELSVFSLDLAGLVLVALDLKAFFNFVFLVFFLSQMAIGAALGIRDAPKQPPSAHSVLSLSPALSWPYRANPAGSSLAKLNKGNPQALFILILIQLVFWLEVSEKSVKLLAKPG